MDRPIGMPINVPNNVPSTLGFMEFVIVGHAKSEFVLSEADEDALNEEHWAYMDNFASALIARGPILSSDGTEDWKGSVHIITAEDRSFADRFAFDEPYWRAGQYEAVHVSRFDNVLQSTMWQRPRDPECSTSWLARWEWPNDPHERATGDVGDFRQDPALAFAGFLVSDDGSRASGFIAGIDASAADINRVVYGIGERLSRYNGLMLDRWRRGGRPSE